MIRYPFNGKVALVTGGTDGIGLAAAAQFAACGARVFITGRNAERGARAVEAVRHHGADVHFHAADMGQPAEVAAMVAACVARFGRIDFAVNNAAAEFPLVKLHEIPVEAVNTSVAVDLVGVWHCMKHEIEQMLKQGGGAIVNVSSVNGFWSSPKAAVYSATKHGMNGLGAAAAKEYAAEGIRINTVCPGAIETPRRERRLTGFTPEQVKQHYDDTHAKVPLGRVGRAEEVAEGILWLCS
ncbi:MAG: SDR family NAD(P)-dependent oxidoreductase, partial [Betaproteobacteria bacterium]|nr:SDR family NAD(P)-dependent oxidoreductase [Betaproteobacteria bacterium]